MHADERGGGRSRVRPAADPILFYVEFWADKIGIAMPPNLAAHCRRMLDRPVVQRVLREEGYNLALLGVEQSRPN